VESYDEVENKNYAFIVFCITDLNTGKSEVRIRSNVLTGTSLSTEKARVLAKKAQKAGTRGNPFTPAGKLDKRQVEYRFYQEKGEPTAVEIFIVTRDVERKAKEPKILKIDWPQN